MSTNNWNYYINKINLSTLIYILQHIIIFEMYNSMYLLIKS